MKYTVSPKGYYYKVNSKGHKTRISRLEYTKRNKNGIGGGLISKFFRKNKESNSKKSTSRSGGVPLSQNFLKKFEGKKPTKNSKSSRDVTVGTEQTNNGWELVKTNRNTKSTNKNNELNIGYSNKKNKFRAFTTEPVINEFGNVVGYKKVPMEIDVRRPEKPKLGPDLIMAHNPRRNSKRRERINRTVKEHKYLFNNNSVKQPVSNNNLSNIGNNNLNVNANPRITRNNTIVSVRSLNNKPLHINNNHFSAKNNKNSNNHGLSRNNSDIRRSKSNVSRTNSGIYIDPNIKPNVISYGNGNRNNGKKTNRKNNGLNFKENHFA